MQDSKIIELLFERSENAIVELSKRFSGICFRIAINILGNHEDAEECVNDTYLAVWNAVPPKKPNPLQTFVCRLTRNISINKYIYNSAQKRNGNLDLCLEEIKDCVSGGAAPESELELSELSGYIDAFIDKLSSVNRFLFVRRYWYMDSYDVLSAETGLSEGSIRTRLSRTRASLKKYLISKGVDV